MDRNHLNNFESRPTKDIPVKFDQNPINGLGGDVVWRKIYRCTHAQQRTNCVTGELKSNVKIFTQHAKC